MENIIIPPGKLRRARTILAIKGGWHCIRQQMGDEKFSVAVGNEINSLAQKLKDANDDNVPDAPAKSLYFEGHPNDEIAYGLKRINFDDTEKSWKKHDMRCFWSRHPHNYEALEHIYYGLIQFDIPHEMLRQMNTIQILALYLGIDSVKRCQNFSVDNQGTTLDILLKMDVPEAVRRLVDFGYSFSNSIRLMEGRGYHELPEGGKCLAARLCKLDEETLEEFRNGMKHPYKSLARKQGTPVLVFGSDGTRINPEMTGQDPNDEAKKDTTAKQIYVNHIISLLTSLYQRNIGK